MDLMVTQFAWPCLLSSFWHIFCHAGPFTHLWVLMSASWANTHCQSFFLSKGWECSLRIYISYQPISFPSLLPRCPNVHVPLRSQVTGNNVGGQRVCDKNWSCLGMLTDNWWCRMFWCPGKTEWWKLYRTKTNTHADTSVWPHKWFMDVFNQALMGNSPESLQCTPENLHLLSVCDTLSFSFYIGA